MPKNRSFGFTLSELLIALAILGICLSVSIPLMAQSREQSQKKVAFKEALWMLETIMREGMTTGELVQDNFGSYYLGRINAVKTCRNNASTDGCWNFPTQSYAGSAAGDESDEPGVILASGMQIVGFNNPYLAVDDPCGCLNGLLLDWNGPKTPNRLGQDQLWVMISYGDKPSCFNDDRYGLDQKPGTVIANRTNNMLPADVAPNQALYDSLFQ
jgi:prepilin-type N-terminal cleavage/methylation domain-containing protein